MSEFLGIRYQLPIGFEVRKREFSSEAVTGSRTTLAVGGTWYAFSISFGPLITRDEAGLAILAAHRSAHGTSVPFQIPIVNHPALAIPSNVIRLRATEVAGKNTIRIDGTNSPSVPVGTFFNIAGQDRIYMVTAVGEDSERSATLTISPNLAEAAGDNAQLNFTPSARVTYDPDALSIFEYLRGGFSEIAIDVVESF